MYQTQEMPGVIDPWVLTYQPSVLPVWSLLRNVREYHASESVPEIFQTSPS